MKYKFYKISKESYDTSKEEKINFLSEDELQTVFACIETSHKRYLLSWHCEACSLLLREVENGVFLLAIDLKVIVIDFKKEHYHEIELDFYFCEAVKISDALYVICTQQEVMLLDIFTLSIVHSVHLSDSYASCSIHHGFLEIHMMDGTCMKVNNAYLVEDISKVSSSQSLRS